MVEECLRQTISCESNAAKQNPVNANSTVLMVRTCPYVLHVGLPALVEVGRRGVVGKGEALGALCTASACATLLHLLDFRWCAETPLDNMDVLNNHLQGAVPGETALARPSVHPWDICACLASSSVFPALHMNS